jgi:hypothetical protein
MMLTCLAGNGSLKRYPFMNSVCRKAPLKIAHEEITTRASGSQRCSARSVHDVAELDWFALELLNWFIASDKTVM